MSQSPISLLLRRRLALTSLNPNFFLLSLNKPFSTTPSPDPSKPTSLSARMSFVFDQIDAIERERLQKHQTLHRIRAWRHSKQTPDSVTPSSSPPEAVHSQTEGFDSSVSGNGDTGKFLAEDNAGELVGKKRKGEVEVVHPWPEWVDLMERLVRQNYFDHRRKDEGKMVESLGLGGIGGFGDEGEDDDDDVGIDFKDFKTVQTACLNFGKDRFDILRSLSRQDIQVLVGYGCPSVDRKVVFSAKVLRKQVHLDEGDVCSNCILRSSCEKAFLLTNKEDEARTIDVMRVLLTYGFDPINGLVVNKSLLKQKSVRTVVRKLLHEVVKLSAVPIDPNLPPPVIKRPPPKVKQPPPPPKKRVGRDDIEMKKGDWLCPKCDFMNFAKNTVCLQCDAKRPKRQLLPGEWECPECNFLNYRRNMACFHCECKRPPDAYIEEKMEDMPRGPKTRLEKIANRPEVSNAWNFDFDDNESDGADVAAFEYADSAAMGEDSPLGNETRGGSFRGHDDDLHMGRSFPGTNDKEYSERDHIRQGTGFDDFDDEDDVDSYELDTGDRSPARKVFQDKFSEHGISELEEFEGSSSNLRSHQRTSTPKHMRQKATFSDSENDESDVDSDEELSVHPKWKSSHVADTKRNNRRSGPAGPSRGLSFGSDDEFDIGSDADDDFPTRRRGDKKRGVGRKKFDRSSDAEDVSFSGSESDDNYPHYKGNRSAGNKLQNGRRGNKSRHHGDYDFVSDTRTRSKGKAGDRRNTWDDDFDRSSRRSDAKTREFRDNNRSNRRDSWNDDFGTSSRGNQRGFRDNGRAGMRMNDRENDSWNLKGSKRGGFQDRQRGRSQENHIDKDRDYGEFRNSRRVIER